MMKMFRRTMFTAGLILAAAQLASAQSTDGGEVMYHFGPLHLAPGQAMSVNFELTDHIGEPLTLPVELHLEDRMGDLIYSNGLAVPSGRAVSFAIGPEIRSLRTALPAADIYAVIGPDIRLIQPCIKVIFPPGPTLPVDRITVTLEIVDLQSGRVVTVVNNPHAIIAVLKQ